MRGRFQDQGGMFSYIHPEKRIPANHPLRKIRELVREVLKELNHTFRRLYSHEGRPSIPPEQLLSALILQVLYSVRSERQLMEQLDYNLLFRWFVGLSPDDPIWDPSAQECDRLRARPATSATRSQTCRKMATHNARLKSGTAAVGATSCSISSPTISCASPSSSPPEAESARKPENRLRQTENPTTKDGNGLGYRRFFSKLLGPSCRCAQAALRTCD